MSKHKSTMYVLATLAIKSVLFLCAVIALMSFANPHKKHGNKRKAHRCHQDRYNNRPHPPGKAGNFKHDLSRYSR